VQGLVLHVTRTGVKILVALLVAPLLVVFVARQPSQESAQADELPTQSSISILLGTGQQHTASALAPGDSFRRPIDVSLKGRKGLNHVSLNLTAVAPQRSLLDSDARNGLWIGIDRCSATTGWVRRGNTGEFTCKGTVTSVVKPTSVAQVKDRQITLPKLVPGKTTHFLLTFRLPPTAGNGFEHLASTLRFTFAATA
jgi:hypothetical protein